MSHGSLLGGSVLAFALAGAIAAGPALAEKPAWAGQKGGQGHGAEKKQGSRDDNASNNASKEGARQAGKVEHFGDQHRIAVRDYYGAEFKSGRCPPGLAKKHNGCMPPGQAKKWALGKPLPHDLVYHDVPHTLAVRLGGPPSGYRYVQVAGDILLIAIGTALVVDAIQDLGR